MEIDMKFIKPFKGATGGDPYPKEFAIGEDCPDDLIAAAKANGAVKDAGQKADGKAGDDGDKES